MCLYVGLCVCVCVCVCVPGGWLEKFAQKDCDILFKLIIALRQESWTGQDMCYTLLEMRYVLKILSKKREGRDLFGKPRRR